MWKSVKINLSNKRILRKIIWMTSFAYLIVGFIITFAFSVDNYSDSIEWFVKILFAIAIPIAVYRDVVENYYSKKYIQIVKQYQEKIENSDLKMISISIDRINKLHPSNKYKLYESLFLMSDYKERLK